MSSPRHRRQRAAAEARDDPPHVEVELVELVQRGLDDPRRDLHAAGHARRRRDQQRQRRGRHAGALGHEVGDLGRRRLARLQAQDGGARLLVPVEVVVELLGADQRAPGPAAHREVAVAIDLPAGVLRRQARDRGPVGGHGERGQPATLDDQRRVRDAPEPSHADLGEAAPRLEASRRLRAAVDDPRAVRERRDLHPRRLGIGGQPVGELQRPFVERKRHVVTSSRIRISPRRSSRPSPHQRA